MPNKMPISALSEQREPEREVPLCDAVVFDYSRDLDCFLSIVSSLKASALHDVRYEELFRVRVCVVVDPQHPFARRRAIPITEVAAEPLIGLTREDLSELL